MIDFGKEAEVNTRSLLYELLDFVDEVVDHFGSCPAIQYIHTMIEQGTGTDKQLKIYIELHSLILVVDYIHNQFLLT